LNQQQRYKFGKDARLKSRKTIQKVFAEGRSVLSNSLKAIWINDNADGTLQTGITVSSRHFKKATDRNRIKRLIRESLRLQKYELEEYLKQQKVNMSMFLMYVGKDLPTQQQMHTAVSNLINKIKHQLDEKNKTLT
jgi:ribonuclease P protein component